MCLEMRSEGRMGSKGSCVWKCAWRYDGRWAGRCEERCELRFEEKFELRFERKRRAPDARQRGRVRGSDGLHREATEDRRVGAASSRAPRLVPHLPPLDWEAHLRRGEWVSVV